MVEQHREHTQAGDTQIICRQIAKGPAARFEQHVGTFLASRGRKHEEAAWHGCAEQGGCPFRTNCKIGHQGQEADEEEMDQFVSVGCRVELAERPAKGAGIGQECDPGQEQTIGEGNSNHIDLFG